MKWKPRNIGVTPLMLFAAACGGQPEVDRVALGQDLALVKADGGVVEGKITSRDDTTV
jgi:hypothetical protein